MYFPNHQRRQKQRKHTSEKKIENKGQGSEQMEDVTRNTKEEQ